MEPGDSRNNPCDRERPGERLDQAVSRKAMAVSRSCRGIALRQVFEDDMPFLFRLFADPGRCHLWMDGRRVYDEREFHQAWAAWTGDTMGAKFIVESGGRPIGLVFEYARSLEDGHTKVTALLEEERVGHGGGAIATALFVGFLFRTLPLRKIYLEVFSYNQPVVAMLRKVGLAEEGVLKGNRFWDGAWWDLHIFALYRETWPEVRERVLRPQREAGEAVATRSGANGKEVIASRINV